MLRMGFLRALLALFRGRSDEYAFRQYRDRLLKWAAAACDLGRDEYRAEYEGRYLDDTGRDLFLDYLLSASKESPSYITEHSGMLADRRKLYERFGLPVLTPRELRDRENDRLSRLDSPLRL
jgi:hypothetical protein